MTKTEAKLLEQVKKSPNGHSSISHGVAKTSGHPYSWGARDFNALIKLRDKGLVEISNIYKWSDAKNGYMTHGTDVTYCLKAGTPA